MEKLEVFESRGDHIKLMYERANVRVVLTFSA